MSIFKRTQEEKDINTAAIHCFTRYLLWTLPLLLIVVELLIVWASITRDINPDISAMFALVTFLSALAFANKFALNKVFFKAYKKITLTPKITEITWLFSLKALARLIIEGTLRGLLYSSPIIVAMIIASLVTDADPDISSFEKPFMFVVRLLGFIANFVTFKKFVLRNAEIQMKKP